MDSSKTQIASKQSDAVNSPMKTSRRSLSSSSSFSSFSSCSSSSLVFPGDSPLNSPATPLSLLGVPFSWERLPGKPKDYPHSHRLNHRRNNNESLSLLPLPPHRNTHFPTTGKKHKSYNSGKKNILPETLSDPFAAALLECSKDGGNSDDDEDDGGEDVDRRYPDSGGSSKTLSKTSIGNRFGLVNLYGSCRRTCAVSESIVHLPTSLKPTSYDHLLLPRRRR